MCLITVFLLRKPSTGLPNELSNLIPGRLGASSLMLLLDNLVDSEEFMLLPFPDEFFIPFGLRFLVYKTINVKQEHT